MRKKTYKAVAGGIEYTVTRMERKTVALCIAEGGAIDVKAPFGVDDDLISAFVVKKLPWIKAHIAKVLEIEASKADYKLKLGGQVLLLGEYYPLKRSEDDHVGFDQLCFYAPEGCDLKRELIKLYKMMALDYMTRCVEAVSRSMGISPDAVKPVKITSAKARWGSCGPNGELCFPWRLIMAEPEAVEYVAVHELAHLTEHNHSPRFWRIVESALPDYKRREAILRRLSIKLAGEDWD